jgi:fluoride exporter
VIPANDATLHLNHMPNMSGGARRRPKEDHSIDFSELSTPELAGPEYFPASTLEDLRVNAIRQCDSEIDHDLELSEVASPQPASPTEERWPSLEQNQRDSVSFRRRSSHTDANLQRRDSVASRRRSSRTDANLQRPEDSTTPGQTQPRTSSPATPLFVWHASSQDDSEIDHDLELSEVASPPPASPKEERRPSLEQNQRDSVSFRRRSSHTANLQRLEEDSTTPGQTQFRTSSPATQLFVTSHLVFFSILGTLARLGVQAITLYPSAPVISPVLWANLGGSLFLGFLMEDRRIFREEWGVFASLKDWSFHPDATESKDADRFKHAHQNHDKVKKTIPLFIGLATGFCGSFTSFSSFIRDAFLALGNDLASQAPGASRIPPRNGGYTFEAVLAVIIIHVTVSLSALIFGAHLALAIDRVTPTLPYKFIRTTLDPLIVFLGFGSWLGAVLLTVFPPHQNWRGKVTFALIFAPLGCLLRYYASKHLNSRIPSFPLGTFAVNIFGTIVLGMCYDLQHSKSIAEDVVSCQVLQGVMDGFCGCATTVSTWVAELKGLRRRHSYIYGATSVVVALLLLIIIMGSLQWTRGFFKPAGI